LMEENEFPSFHVNAFYVGSREVGRNSCKSENGKGPSHRDWVRGREGLCVNNGQKMVKEGGLGKKEKGWNGGEGNKEILAKCE